MIHAFATSRSRSTRRDGWVRKPPPATMGDYLLGGTALKQAPEHPTSASITSIKEKVLNLNDQTAFPAFGKSGGGEKSAGKPAAASKVAPRLAKASKAFYRAIKGFVVSTAFYSGDGKGLTTRFFQFTPAGPE